MAPLTGRLMVLTAAVMVAAGVAASVTGVSASATPSAEANRPRPWSWRRTNKTPPPFKYDKQSHRKWKGLSNGEFSISFPSASSPPLPSLPLPPTLN